MEDTNSIAVTPTVAPVTESAPVQEATVDTSEDTSSVKTLNTQEETQGTNEPVVESKSIPYDRFQEVNEKAKKYEAELAELKKQQEEAQRVASMTPDERMQEQQLAQAKEALRKMGFITKEEQERALQEEKAQNLFISEMNRLEGKHDGKDGMPKFVAREVAEFMDQLAAKGQYISDPETAYKLKFIDEIAEAKAKAQRSTAYSEKQVGGMNQVDDTRSSELEAASKTRDFTQFLKKHAGMPKA